MHKGIAIVRIAPLELILWIQDSIEKGSQESEGTTCENYERKNERKRKRKREGGKTYAKMLIYIYICVYIICI